MARRRRDDLWVTLALTLGAGEGINGREVGAEEGCRHKDIMERTVD